MPKPVPTSRPILFSGQMVRAILEGRKSQTRRVVKVQPSTPAYQLARNISSTGAEGNDASLLSWVLVDGLNILDRGPYFRCPYGNFGDLLYVKETWHPSARLGSEYEIEYKADSSTALVDAGFDGPTPKIDGYIGMNQWRPSLFMPRWASRLTLRITSIRVERVQEISEDDARAEGFPNSDGRNREHPDRARYWYKHLWDSINGKKPGHAWADNPWVWVVEFERLDEGTK